MSNLLKIVEQEYLAVQKALPVFKAGDTVNVHVKIKEGAKERIQQYQGLKKKKRNTGNGASFTVRKISAGIAVERIFPTMSPFIDKIEVLRSGAVRRARLFYLRDKTGKNARIKEKKKPVEQIAK